MRKFQSSLIPQKKPTLISSNRNLKYLSTVFYDNMVRKFKVDKIPHETDDSLKNLAWLSNIDLSLDSEFNLLEPTGNDEWTPGGFPKKLHLSLEREGLFDEMARLEYKTQVKEKPPLSYTTLICMAIYEMGRDKIALFEIYEWIKENFLYYRLCESTWQNSIRHNLSLKKCFEKVPRGKDERGKGGFWRINPQFISHINADLNKSRAQFYKNNQNLMAHRNIRIPQPNARPLIPKLYNSTHNNNSELWENQMYTTMSDEERNSTTLVSYLYGSQSNQEYIEKFESKEPEPEPGCSNQRIDGSLIDPGLSEFITLHNTDKVESQIHESNFNKYYINPDNDNDLSMNYDILEDDLFPDFNSSDLAPLPPDIARLLPDF